MKKIIGRKAEWLVSNNSYIGIQRNFSIKLKEVRGYVNYFYAEKTGTLDVSGSRFVNCSVNGGFEYGNNFGINVVFNKETKKADTRGFRLEYYTKFVPIEDKSTYFILRGNYYEIDGIGYDVATDRIPLDYKGILYLFDNRLAQISNVKMRDVSIIYSDTSISLTPIQLTSSLPAYLASDNLPHAAGECGMWDSINEKFYRNANSTGAFSVENELDEYVEVDLTGICINGKYQRVAVENTEIPQIVWNGVNVKMLMLNGEVVWQEQCIVEIYESLRSTNAFINIGTTFYNTDKIEIRGAITGLYSEDKYILAPSVWNDSNNRFAMLGFCQNKFAVGYGSYITANTELDAQRDSKTRTWTYENKVFSIVELSVTRNVSNINFGAETKELRLFWGYNSITNGTLESYKHYKNDILVRDMLPCKVMYISSDLSVDGKSHSNEDGLWDLVANRFYPKSSASGSINVLGNRTNILKLK